VRVEGFLFSAWLLQCHRFSRSARNPFSRPFCESVSPIFRRSWRPEAPYHLCAGIIEITMADSFLTLPNESVREEPNGLLGMSETIRWLFE
jgi:hypothetical protein